MRASARSLFTVALALSGCGSCSFPSKRCRFAARSRSRLRRRRLRIERRHEASRLVPPLARSVPSRHRPSCFFTATPRRQCLGGAAARHGFQVFLFDYRGFGVEGKPDVENVIATRSPQSARRRATTSTMIPSSRSVIGGAIALTAVAAANHDVAVRALVVDSAPAIFVASREKRVVLADVAAAVSAGVDGARHSADTRCGCSLRTPVHSAIATRASAAPRLELARRPWAQLLLVPVPTVQAFERPWVQKHVVAFRSSRRSLRPMWSRFTQPHAGQAAALALSTLGQLAISTLVLRRVVPLGAFVVRSRRQRLPTLCAHRRVLPRIVVGRVKGRIVIRQAQ
jgi:hypothetical protein